MPDVTLSSGKVFSSNVGDTLLDSAQSNGLPLEYSCKTGRCGVCKVKVVTGNTIALRAEEGLDKRELDSGYILTCCRGALDDIELAAEELHRSADIELRTLPSRIDSLRHLSKDVIEVVLRTPPSSPLMFLAGQHINVIASTGDRRSYSLANSPRDDGRLVLYIRRVLDGLMSEYWFGQAKVNDLLRIEGPLGTFFLRENSSRNLVFLATGTGIAPVKAMLEELNYNPEFGRQGGNIALLWGERSLEDIHWTPRFQNVKCDFFPVLSRADLVWDGRRGYIQSSLSDVGIDYGDCTVYACGSDQMIRSAHGILEALGLPRTSFFSDAFVSSG